MTDRTDLTSLTLSGFQVFDKPTTIPLGRLTFLFGPNSAGKSAVEDALELLRHLTSPFKTGEASRSGYFYADDSQFDQSIHRNWRRESGNPDVYSNQMGIGVSARIFFKPNLTGRSPKKSKYGPLHNVELSVFFHDHHSSKMHIVISLDGMPILLLIEDGLIALNHKHSFFYKLGMATKLKGLKTEFPDVFKLAPAFDGVFLCLENGHFRFSEIGTLGGKVDAERFKDGIFRNAAISENNRIELVDKIDYFLAVYNEILGRLFDEINGKLRFKTVSASRQIPKSSELVYLLEPRNHVREFDYDNDYHDFFIGQHHNHDFWPLAHALAATLDDIAGDIYDDIIGDEGDWKGQVKFVEDIQRTLSGHMFTDRGYQVAFDYRVLLTPSRYDDALNGRLMIDPPAPSEHPMLIRLFLKDAEGRKFSFSEVGSGLGYSLPVLTAIWDPASSKAMLQQPELHLHPALQASLADVFIEATTENRQLLIETHSEHLLLRILKRVRQTASGTLIDQQLALSPEDVVVAYFDPRSDGTTTVRQLRISSDGDFMDSWPRGFFTERDQELFDE